MQNIKEKNEFKFGTSGIRQKDYLFTNKFLLTFTNSV